MPKQEIAKKSTLNLSHLGEALKQQSPKNENKPNTKAKEIGKAKKKKSLSLRDRMLEQLNSSRFRYINEQLYSVPGHEVSISGFFCKITLVNNHTISEFGLKIRSSNMFGYQTAERHDCMLTSVVSFWIF